MTGDPAAAAAQVKSLYKAFVESDCTMVEVNPLAEDSAGTLIAADAKLGFDDNAGFRQAAIFEQRDTSQEDPRDVAAEKWDLNYIGLDGFGSVSNSRRAPRDAAAAGPSGAW